MAAKKEADWLKERITCCVCLKIFDKPHTFACLHTLCKGCVSGLKLIRNGGKDGYNCPMCDQFCEKSSVRHNFLISELLEFYDMIKNKKASKTCKQCKTAKPTRRCVECKADLCDACKSFHDGFELMATHHSISLDDIGHTVLVDQLVFCSKHKTELVKLNCVPCEKPMCAMCKVIDHEGHPCESADDALERILPDIKATQQKILDHIKLSEQKRIEIRAKAEEMCDSIAGLEKEARAAHKRIQERLDEDLASLIQELNGMKDNVREREQSNEEDIDSDIKETKHVTMWLDTTLTTAAGISLLQELQSGVKDKLENTAQSLIGKQEELDEAIVIGNNDIATRFHSEPHDRSNMIGEFITRDDPQGPPINNNSGLWTVDLKQKFNQMPTEMLSVVLDADQHSLNSFSLIMNSLWIPTRKDEKPIILVYSKTGKYERTIKLPPVVGCPRAVDQWHRDGDEDEERIPAVAVLACTKGLFILSQHGELLHILQHQATFSDLCVYNDHIYALEEENCDVHIFNTSLKRIEIIRVDLPHQWRNTLTIVNNHIYICDTTFGNDSVLKYTLDGKKIAQYGEYGEDDEPGRLHSGSLSGHDSTGALLVCDTYNVRLQLLASDGTWHRTSMERLGFCPRYAVQADTNSFWILGDDYGKDPKLHLYKFK